MHKKAQIGASLTWGAAFLIILIMITLYMSFTIMLKQAKNPLGFESNAISTGLDSRVIYSDFIYFLSQNNIDDKAKFEKNAADFLKAECVSLNCKNAWIKIMNKDYPLDDLSDSPSAFYLSQACKASEKNTAFMVIKDKKAVICADFSNG